MTSKRIFSYLAVFCTMSIRMKIIITVCVLLPMLISCGKEDKCNLITKDDCTSTGSAPSFILKKCPDAENTFYYQNEGTQFLFTNEFSVGSPTDYTLVDVGKRSVTHQFNIPGNTLLRYWHGNYFYYLALENPWTTVSLVRYDLKSKTSTELINTPYIFTSQIVDDKLFIFEITGGNVDFPDYGSAVRLYEIDLKTGNIIDSSQLPNRNDAKHIYIEYRNNERIIVTVLEDRRVEYNDSKKIPIGDFPLNISAKIKRFVYKYGEILHYHTDKGEYFYHSKYKTSIPPDDVNNVLIDNEYFLINNRLHGWKDLREIEGYKGPVITGNNRGRYFLYKNILCYTENNTVNLHKFTEEKPYKVYTYCNSLSNFYGRTVVDDELYLQNSDTKLIKVKL